MSRDYSLPRELASRGVSIIVLEEDHEIGTPEHCGGVVSLQGLNALGILPDGNVVQNNIINAQIKDWIISDLRKRSIIKMCLS